MLKKGKVFNILLVILVTACTDTNVQNDYHLISKTVVGDSAYIKNYNEANDSLSVWTEKLNSYDFLEPGRWRLDSLLCYNSNGTRFVTCILSKCGSSDCKMDDLHLLYGAKINSAWYFFSGSATIYLPRKIYQTDEHTPLSFEKMHQIALKEVFSGYLNEDGQINDDFFKYHFENSGWGLDKGTKEDYEKIYLEKVKNNWASRKKDSIPLP